MRILFVEDEPESIAVVRTRLEEEISDIDSLVVNFKEATETIGKFRPDLVVLDILQGGSQPNPVPEGLVTGDFIRQHHFCPLIVYSAEPSYYDDKYDEHPLVKSIRKGSGSEELVLKAFRDFEPIVEAMRSTESEIHRQLTEAMKTIAPIANANPSSAGNLAEAVIRSGRRRIAALMDDPLPGEEAIASWEQYLYPPVSPHTLLGDVLQIDGSSNDPESFRIVLTPSCDMVRSGGQTPKVQYVLVAKCCSMQEALALIGMADNRNANRIRDRLLSSGHYQSVIPFPALEGVIPTMAANLRDLELIPIAAIGDEATFRTVASLDSPFRELVAWAYLQNAGRPGLPDRDMESWAKEIIGTL